MGQTFWEQSVQRCSTKEKIGLGAEKGRNEILPTCLREQRAIKSPSGKDTIFRALQCPHKILWVTMGFFHLSVSFLLDHSVRNGHQSGQIAYSIFFPRHKGHGE